MTTVRTRGSGLGPCHYFLLTSLVDYGWSPDQRGLGIVLLAECQAVANQWVTISISFKIKKIQKTGEFYSMQMTSIKLSLKEYSLKIEYMRSNKNKY